jgi:hypothetical protein
MPIAISRRELLWPGDQVEDVGIDRVAQRRLAVAEDPTRRYLPRAESGSPALSCRGRSLTQHLVEARRSQRSDLNGLSDQTLPARSHRRQVMPSISSHGETERPPATLRIVSSWGTRAPRSSRPISVLWSEARYPSFSWDSPERLRQRRRFSAKRSATSCLNMVTGMGWTALDTAPA